MRPIRARRTTEGFFFLTPGVKREAYPGLSRED
jgi:hypothetical protein